MHLAIGIQQEQSATATVPFLGHDNQHCCPGNAQNKITPDWLVSANFSPFLVTTRIHFFPKGKEMWRLFVESTYLWRLHIYGERNMEPHRTC